jgi:Domain of unknown function (DUF4160)
MPTVHTINSIKIDVYSREHLPPHFPALYVEHEILIEIRSFYTYAGSLPAKQYNMVMKWVKGFGVQSFLMNIFERLNPHLK